MRLIAFDQSSRVTGFAVFDNNQLILHDKFTCTSEDIGERLVQIRQMIIGLVTIYNPDAIAFEDIQLQNNVVNNVETFKVLAEVFGVFYETVKELGLTYYIVPSVTWKSKLGIKGIKRPEQKRAAAAYVLDKYHVKATQDECDAICIGSYVINIPEDYDWSD